jgi:hypothetical protein
VKIAGKGFNQAQGKSKNLTKQPNNKKGCSKPVAEHVNRIEGGSKKVEWKK